MLEAIMLRTKTVLNELTENLTIQKGSSFDAAILEEKFDCPRMKGTMRLGSFHGRIELLLKCGEISRRVRDGRGRPVVGNGRLARGALERGLVENISEIFF